MAIMIIVSLVGCSNNPEKKTFEKANALMEEEKYEEAIALYQSIESYEKIASKIAEAEALLAASDTSTDYLYTKWIDTIHYHANEKTLTFHEDGTVYDRQGSTEYVHKFIWENGELAIIASTQVVVLRLTAEEIDGIMHLKGSYGSANFAFVPEKDYDSFSN